ncbi:MAG: SigB/SigF/SigG family RNA polymerase sigma factor [Lachnospiraceae bacterium]|nr:SigB/SigF/SigG family RNA polymerase sigma factor [Lachnospiraceae bacterium]MBQ8118322.1 SigB/SigF/SigG family RNA polymerase sigma factor [Lachnospiraceae bacterium]
MEDMSVLIGRSQSGDKEAREVLIEKNLGLVHHIVRRFAGRGYEMEDLFQIGVIGLIKAIDKFDLKQEVQFSTYAVPMITGEIKRFLRDDGPIKVSRTLKENAVKIRAARQQLQSSLGREPTLRELADTALLSEEEIVMASTATAEVESIYASVYQADGSELYLVDRVADAGPGNLGSVHGEAVDYEKEALLNHMLLQQLLDELDERERSLIRMRYFENRTQTEVADVLGISQVQVSRLEKKILLRMRRKIA